MTATVAPTNASLGNRELVFGTVLIVGAGRLVDGPIAWLVAALLIGFVALGALQVLAEHEAATELGVPVEAILDPAVAAFAAYGAIRVVPVGYQLLVALALVGWLMRRVLATETRLVRSRSGPSSSDRARVQGELLTIGFLGFVGVAALVPGGLPPGIGGLDDPQVAAPTGVLLAVIAGADGLLGFALGYRAAALRSGNFRDVVWAALTSGGIVGIAAAGVRAIEAPRLLGPALLTVVFFLWETIHANAPTGRRNQRRIWEAILLVVLGGAVTAWSLRLRG